MSIIYTELEDRIVEFPNDFKQVQAPGRAEGIVRMTEEPGAVTQTGDGILAEHVNNAHKLGVYLDLTASFEDSGGANTYKISIDNFTNKSIFNEMKIGILVPETNNKSFIKLSINDEIYNAKKILNDLTYSDFEINDIQKGKILYFIYNGTSFTIDSSLLPATNKTSGITQYGTEEMMALEGHRLAQILGVEYGGEIQIETTKEEGKAYYDQTTMYLYLCTETNTLNYADLSKYKAFSNFNLLNEIDDLKTTVIESMSLPGVTELYLEKKGDIAILSIDSGTAFDGRTTGQVLFVLPVGWRPKHNIHLALVPGVGETQTVPVIIKPNGQAIFIGSGTLSQPKYGSITYFL